MLEQHPRQDDQIEAQGNRENASEQLPTLASTISIPIASRGAASAPLSIKAVVCDVLSLGTIMTLSRLVKEGEVLIQAGIVSHLGFPAVATLISSYQSTVWYVMLSPTFYIFTAINEANVPATRQKVGSVIQGEWLIGVGSAVAQFVCLSFAGPALIKLGQSPGAAGAAQEYFNVYRWALPALCIQTISDASSQVLRQVRQPILTSFSCLAVSSFLAYGLAGGVWFLPNLGIQGAAWGVVTRAYLNLLVYHTYMLISDKRGSVFSGFGIFNRPENIFACYWTLLKKGFPIAINVASEIIALFTLTLLVGVLGKEELTAQLVVTQWRSFLLMPTMGLTITANILIPRLPQEKRHLYARTIRNIGWVLPTLYIIGSVAIPRQMSKPFLNIHDHPKAEQDLAKGHLMGIGAVTSFFEASKNIYSGCSLALGEIFRAALMSIIGVWSGVLIGRLLEKEMDPKNNALNIGIMIGFIIATGLQYNLWRIKSRLPLAPVVPPAGVTLPARPGASPRLMARRESRPIQAADDPTTPLMEEQGGWRPL